MEVDGELRGTAAGVSHLLLALDGEEIKAKDGKQSCTVPDWLELVVFFSLRWGDNTGML